MTLQGKVALVTGGAKGLGRAIAESLVRSGATVVVADLDEEAARAFASGMPEQLLARRCDVTNEDDVQGVMTEIAREHGHLDILVNNAGIQLAKPTAEMSTDEWRRVLEVDLTAPFVCSRLAYPLLRAAGAGCIVNISSVSAMAAMPQRAPYSASKAGVLALTRVLAVEWAEDGIRVNAVAPGYILTDLNRRAMDAGVFNAASVEERTALGHLGEPKDVAMAVSWLCDSESSAYVTGTVLTVDGGWSIVGQRPLMGPGSRAPAAGD